jgi:hypothetical protein
LLVFCTCKQAHQRVCILNLFIDEIRKREAPTKRTKCQYGICMLAALVTAALSSGDNVLRGRSWSYSSEPGTPTSPQTQLRNQKNINGTLNKGELSRKILFSNQQDPISLFIQLSFLDSLCH